MSFSKGSSLFERKETFLFENYISLSTEVNH